MYKLKKQIPNIITISRIFSLLLGFILFIRGNIILSLILYIYGGISDAIDGYLARKLNAYSKFGQYLDAISDKLYFLSLIVILLLNNKYLIVVSMIIEIIISIINYLNIKKRRKIFTERIGKFKTTIFMITLIFGIIAVKVNIFNYLYYIFFILTTYLHIQTIIAYINQLNGNSKEKNVDFRGMNIKERVMYLLKEFIQYLIKPVKLIRED